MNRVDQGKAARAAAAEPHAKIDVLKVLDRIAAALAALDEREAPKPKPAAQSQDSAEPGRRIRLRHNWG